MEKRKAYNIRFHFDPRTKLILLILFSVVVMIDVTDGPAYVVRAIMTYIPVILVCLEGKPHIGARFTVLFIFATWLTEVAQDNIGGVAGMLILFLCFMITQFAPILTPRAYWLKKGIKRPGKGKEQAPTKWNSSSVTKILSLQEYCGDILNFKTYSKSYKNKKRIENDRENWVIFKDVHEPIIERAVFEQVQQKRGKIRKRRTHEGERNMFSGLLVCADCGHNLHFHFNQGNPDIKYFNCSNYKGNRGSCTSTHYVRVDFLEQVVLGEIRRLTKFASQFEDEFVKAVIGHSQQAEATGRKLKEKELKALQARDEELDGLFERIYEDNVSGKLSDDRFARMSRRYEEEQKELAEKIKALRAEIDKQNSQSMTTDMFISLVRKYTRARKLTPRMLNELIEKIEVFNAEKVDGVWEQRLRIHYNCVGAIEIPDLIPLPAPEVSVNTRKGVVVNYAPSTIAG